MVRRSKGRLRLRRQGAQSRRAANQEGTMAKARSPDVRKATDPAPPAKRSARPAPRARQSEAGMIVRAPVTLEARRALIAENAYLRAERRGFAPGHETEDWLAAEIEVDALLTAEGGGSPQ